MNCFTTHATPECHLANLSLPKGHRPQSERLERFAWIYAAFDSLISARAVLQSETAAKHASVKHYSVTDKAGTTPPEVQ